MADRLSVSPLGILTYLTCAMHREGEFFVAQSVSLPVPLPGMIAEQLRRGEWRA